jgi:sulfur-oxidizing protein SoxY
MDRRQVLKGAGAAGVVSVAIAAGLLKSTDVFAAYNKAGFDTKDVGAAMASAGGASAVASADVVVKAPDIAENGAVVPVEVISNIAGTTRIAIVGEKNSQPLIADFTFSNGGVGYVSTRIKMGATSNIVGVVHAGGKAFKGHKEVKVTIGGCGG